jgi:UDP-N-acetylmuramoyl-tripeptide--D-alanyl-D-alanine ligase
MFTVNELLKATKGRLISGNPEAKTKAISVDSRTIRPSEAFIAIKGSNFDGYNFIGEAVRKGAKAVIAHSPLLVSASPAGGRQAGRLIVRSSNRNKVSFILVKDTVKALGDIARFQRERFGIPIIAVTGSNGKTTTKEMIAWVLSDRFKALKNAGTKNNHIGLPLTLLNLNSSYECAVLELGTSHFGELGYLAKICLPNIGVITNVGPAHLEYFRDLKGVFSEKYSLIKHLKNPRIAILNADDIFFKEEVRRASNRRITFSFGIKNHSDFFASRVKMLNGKIKFLVNRKYEFSLNTLGYYNIYNALVAIALARLFGLSYRGISRRICAFNFPQNRLQHLELNNIKFINDTYNSNPASLKQALDVLGNLPVKGRKIFVMGDMLELGPRKELFHRQAGRQAAGICDVFITVGGLSEFAASGAASSGLNMKNIFTCSSNLEAKDTLFNKVSAGPDDIVLIKGSRAMMMEEILKI